MLHQERVYASVNLDNIRYNIRQIREYIPKKTKIMAVIKADGYGHGAVRIAQELALAMEARCYHGGKNRTRMNEIRFDSGDAVAAVLLVLFLAVIIGSRFITLKLF